MQSTLKLRKRLQIQAKDLSGILYGLDGAKPSESDAKCLMRVLKRYPKQLLKKRTALDKNLTSCPTSYNTNRPKLTLQGNDHKWYCSSGNVSKVIKSAKNINKLLIKETNTPDLKIMKYIHNILYARIYTKDFFIEFDRIRLPGSLQDESLNFKISMLHATQKNSKVLTLGCIREILRRFKSTPNTTKINVSINLNFPGSLSILSKLITNVCQLESSTFFFEITVPKDGHESISLLKPLLQKIEFLNIVYPSTDLNYETAPALRNGERKALKLIMQDYKPLPSIQELIAECECLETLYVNYINSSLTHLKNFCIPKTLKNLYLTLTEMHPLSSVLPNLTSALEDANCLDKVHLITEGYQRDYMDDYQDICKLISVTNLNNYKLCISDDFESILTPLNESKVTIVPKQERLTRHLSFDKQLLAMIDEHESSSFFIQLRFNKESRLNVSSLQNLLQQIEFLCIERDDFNNRAFDLPMIDPIRTSRRTLRLLIDKDKGLGSNVLGLVQNCQSLRCLYADDAGIVEDLIKTHSLSQALGQLALIPCCRQSDDSHRSPNTFSPKGSALIMRYIEDQSNTPCESEASTENSNLDQYRQSIKTYKATYTITKFLNSRIHERFLQMENLEDLQLSLIVDDEASLKVMQILLDRTFQKLKHLKLKLSLSPQLCLTSSQSRINLICFLLDGLFNCKELETAELMFESVIFGRKDATLSQLYGLKGFKVSTSSIAIKIAKGNYSVNADLQRVHNQGILNRISQYTHKYQRKEQRTMTKNLFGLEPESYVAGLNILPKITICSENLFSSLFNHTKTEQKEDNKINSRPKLSTESHIKQTEHVKTVLFNSPVQPLQSVETNLQKYQKLSIFNTSKVDISSSLQLLGSLNNWSRDSCFADYLSSIHSSLQFRQDNHTQNSMVKSDIRVQNEKSQNFFTVSLNQDKSLKSQPLLQRV